MATITKIKRVKNDRFQAEILDSIEKGKLNVLGLLNKGDIAFQPKSHRYAWFPVTVKGLVEIGVSSYLIEKIKQLELGQQIEINLVDPKLNGEKLRVQVTETTVPNVWQRDNYLRAAKQLEITPAVINNTAINKHEEIANHVDETGYFLTEEGNYIFSNTTVTVESQLQHTFLEGWLTPAPVLQRLGATLSEPIAVGVNVEQD